MIRVVLDTNILVSALLQPKGLPARTFLITLAGTTAQLGVSGDVYAEYEEVIRRPKFKREETIIESAVIRQNSGSGKKSTICTLSSTRPCAITVAHVPLLPVLVGVTFPLFSLTSKPSA
jgi:predicted nucleic acid-binding protein